MVHNGPFFFLCAINSATGKIPVTPHPLEGNSLVDEVFVCTTGKGSKGGDLAA
jgi:predicted aconitase with swiveling domain